MKTTNHTNEINEIRHSLELIRVAVKNRIIKADEGTTLIAKTMKDAASIRLAMLNERRAS